MDLHIVPGITAKDAAEAHRKDIDVENFFGCKTMTYWVDEDRGNAFCLIQAPNKEAVIEMHNKAHGLIPHEIIEVNESVVDAFLGRINDPESFDTLSDSDVKLFNDPAFRTVMLVQTEDEGLLKHKYGHSTFQSARDVLNERIDKLASNHKGRPVDLDKTGTVVSFDTSRQAVLCAMDIQKSIDHQSGILGLKCGIHAGVPVGQHGELFGSTLRMAEYLCWVGDENQIIPSSLVRDFYGIPVPANSQSKYRILEKKNELFLERLMNLLHDRGLEPTFDISEMADELALSKAHLYRRCKKITRMSSNELIREFRLRKSLEFLRKNAVTIAEAAYEAGFGSPSYFTRCFSDRFNIHPSAYQGVC